MGHRCAFFYVVFLGAGQVAEVGLVWEYVWYT